MRTDKKTSQRQQLKMGTLCHHEKDDWGRDMKTVRDQTNIDPLKTVLLGTV